MTDEIEGQPSQGTEVAVQPDAGAEVAVPEPEPAPVWPPPPTSQQQLRKARLWLPLLLPIGAILTVAFVAFNLSRVFLAAAKGDTTPSVIIAAGITVAILVGATVIASLPKLRSSSLVVTISGVMVLLLLSGSVVLGASEPEKKAAAGGYVEPTGPALEPGLDVEALPTLSFQSKAFTVGAGVRTVHYIDGGGSHTLVFDQGFPGFELAVPNGKSSLKVDFKEGQKLTIYCTIPGHRQAGMEATVTVVAAAAGASTQPGSQTATTTTTIPGADKAKPNGNPNTDPADQSGNSTGS